MMASKSITAHNVGCRRRFLLAGAIIEKRSGELGAGEQAMEEKVEESRKQGGRKITTSTCRCSIAFVHYLLLSLLCVTLYFSLVREVTLFIANNQAFLLWTESFL
jgi:hypothetical protein